MLSDGSDNAEGGRTEITIADALAVIGEPRTAVDRLAQFTARQFDNFLSMFSMTDRRLDLLNRRIDLLEAEVGRLKAAQLPRVDMGDADDEGGAIQ
jgi:hypothetical protein